MEGRVRLSVLCLRLGSGQWVSGSLEVSSSTFTSGGGGGGAVKGFLDPEQLPVLQVWIHGVAPAVPSCPSQLRPQPLGQ